MNAVISVIRWIMATPSAGKAVAVTAVAPSTDQDIRLSLAEAGLASHYIRVVTAVGGGG